MVESVITVQEAGIDWLTASATELPAANLLACVAETITDLVSEGGYKRRRWAQWGFTGESARWVSWGRRAQDTVVVLSSWAAEAFFRDIIRHATNVSRLDIAVTVKTVPMMEGVARDHYESLLAAGPGPRCHATVSLIQSSDGGSTAYVGRRSSDKWLRCYDKQRESGDEAYAGCWRYELETKNDVAMALARSLSTSPDRAAFVRSTLYRYCVAHALRPIFTADGDYLPLLTPRPPTDLGRQCEWLTKSVSKTACEVVAAIGLDAFLSLLALGKRDVNGESATVVSPHGHHAYEESIGI